MDGQRFTEAQVGTVGFEGDGCCKADRAPHYMV